MTSKPTALLHDTVASQQDLSALIMELHEALKWVTHETVKKKAGGKQQSTPPQTSESAAQLIHEHGATEGKLEVLIADLDAILHKGNVITITLAAQPSNSVKAKLVAWCRKEISPDVLVNFSFNKSLLGGMVVRAGSRVFDWSFRRLILESSDKFPEVLRRV
jgi:predicted transcriptional regulator